jgi:phosphatidylserine/phosphatidylglycerophosphate/cardiolipin synthase-like enzyme
LRQNGILVKTENYAGKMHSKSMIIDDEYTIIGSMNFSYSGENKNDENLIVINNENVAKFYRQFFIYQWNRIDNKWLKFNARAEGKDSIGSCSDGIDNDYDGLIDLDEPACK